MSAAQRATERCRALKKNGCPCQAHAVRDGLCIGHQPNARDAQRKGGAATSNTERAAKALPSMLRPISAELVRAFGEVHRGEIEPRVGAALATLANALVHVFQAGEHEDRIRQLEQRAHEEGLWRDHKGRDRGPIQWDD